MIGLRTRRAGAPDPPPPAMPERPRLATGVLVHEPVEDGAPWVVQFAGARYVRVGAGMARILRSADGTHTTSDIARHLGAPWTPDLVGQGLLKAQRLRLLDDGAPPAKQPSRWFRFVPPLTFQFTLVDPDPLLRRVRPVLARLANRGAAAVVLAVILGGLLALAATAGRVRDVLGSPLPLGAFLVVFAVTWVGTALHEMAHGAVLSHYGGRPNRLGVMLFYLTPAFFCDVTDGWRLPRNRQRVNVSLAGVVTQAVIGGVAAFGAVATRGTAAEALYLVAVGSYAAGLFNLLPFVKLDGYLALMSHVDTSHLRDRSMADARRMAARVLFGGRYRRELPDLPWARWYGAVCIVFPVYLVGMGFVFWQSMLAGMGIVGLTFASLVVSYVLIRVYAAANRLVREARAAGASRRRVAAGVTLLLGAVVALLQLVSVPYTVSGGFVRDGDRVTLVMLGNTDRQAIAPGAEVRLRRGGVLLHPELGRAVVAGTARRPVSAPVTAFVPLRGMDGVRVPAEGIPLDAGTMPGAAAGTATVSAGRRTLGQWLYLRYFAPFWR